MDTTNDFLVSRPFSLWIYLLIVFGLSWPFQIAGVIWGKDITSLYLFNATAMIMVTVGTYIAGRFVFRDGFAGAGWRWGKPIHYLAVLGLVALIWLAPTLVRILTGSITAASVDRAKFIWLAVLPLVTLIPGFGEEFGWRGYMLPRLARRMSPRRAVMAHSVIWWAWHLPVLAGAGIVAGRAAAGQAGLPVALSVAVTVTVAVLVAAIPAILHGVIIAYLWTRSQSLAVVTVYHALYDGVRDSFSLVAGLPSMVGLWANVVIILFGIAFLWKGDWRNLAAFRGAGQPEIVPPGS